MASYREINYSLRPAKAVERKMLCEAFRRLHPFGKIETYRYVGFGSLYFTDFHLFHRSLGLVDMLSIEKDEHAKESFEFNKPFKCVDMDFRDSSLVLPGLNWQPMTVTWLDYDGKLDKDVLADIQTVCAKTSHGSVLLVSINIQLDQDLPDSERKVFEEETKTLYSLDAYRLYELRKKIGETLPDDVTGRDLRDKIKHGRFSNKDLTGLPSLAEKFKMNPLDPVSAFVVSRFSSDTMSILAPPSFTNVDLAILADRLVEEFNQIVEGPLIYETTRFSGVVLRPETKQFLDQQPRGANLIRLNRLLLEDAYSAEIARRRSGMAGLNQRIITNIIQETLSARNATLSPEKKMEFRQIINFLYNDGAKMLTLGGVFFESAQQSKFDACSFEELSFVRRGADPFDIHVPCLTMKEISRLNSQLPKTSVGKVKIPGVSDTEIANYAEIYRFFPTFAEAVFA